MNKLIFISSVFLFLLECAKADISITAGSPVVSTPDGSLRGQTLQSRNQRDYYAFRGIKYGVIPQRFDLAHLPQPWTDVVDATNFGSKCPQIALHTGAVTTASEDCLFLNVYAPSTLKERKDIPVMFWIHGGGFMDGAGSYMGADFFMDEDVILVTINYRLGIFGFLNTEDGSVPANLGLKDMILALKWVQRNIAGFGGDPEKVTIFGESAGGVSVHLLMLSPVATGLFRGVIAQSGSALTSWSINTSPKTAINRAVKSLGCPKDRTSDILKCFKEASIEQLLLATKDASSNEGATELVFAPSVESIFASSEDYLAVPDIPYNLITKYKKNSKKVPLIMGLNEKEGTLFCGQFLVDDYLMVKLISDWAKVTSIIFGYGEYVPDTELNTFADTLKSIYFGQERISKGNTGTLIQMFTQVLVERGARLSTELHAHEGAQVFPYVLTHRGEFSLSQMFGVQDGGPTHADELQYLFPSLLTPIKNWPDLKPNSTDEEFSKKLVKLWASFAIDGKPTAVWGDIWEPTIMKSLETSNYPILRIDMEAPMKPDTADDFSKLIHADILIAAYEKPKMSWRAEKQLRDEL